MDQIEVEFQFEKVHHHLGKGYLKQTLSGQEKSWKASCKNGMRGVGRKTHLCL